MSRLHGLLLFIVLLAGCGVQDSLMGVSIEDKKVHFPVEEESSVNENKISGESSEVEVDHQQGIAPIEDNQIDADSNEVAPSENEFIGKEESDEDLVDIENLEKEVIETMEELDEIEKNLQELDSLTEELAELERLDQELKELEELLEE
jgi:hypothetical protein